MCENNPDNFNFEANYSMFTYYLLINVREQFSLHCVEHYHHRHQQQGQQQQQQHKLIWVLWLLCKEAYKSS